MDKAKSEKIEKLLRKKGGAGPCIRCQGMSFEIIAETNISIKDDSNNLVIGGPSIPCVSIACLKCGFIYLHSSILLEKE